MKNLRNKLLMIFILVLIFCFSTATGVNAVLQSNGGTVATKKIDEWMEPVRKMEASGGTLGLSETINSTGLLATTPSNGLDCHMEKNTEYGALAILSASAYGNPNKIVASTAEKPYANTTTGNASGAIMNINKEWVAAGAGLTGTTYAKNADSRYINNDYTTTAGGKYHVGDAMNIGTWHSSSSTTWLKDSTYFGLVRAYGGSIFSYCGEDYRGFYAAWAGQYHATRAVVVIGANL